MIESIINMYLTLLDKGINIISIAMIIIFTNVVKNIFAGYKFYNKKTKSSINLVFGLILSLIISYVTFLVTTFSINGVLYTALIGSAISVYSNEIVKSVQKRFRKEE